MVIAPPFAMTTYGGFGLMMIHLVSSMDQNTWQCHQIMFNGTIVLDSTDSRVHALWA